MNDFSLKDKIKKYLVELLPKDLSEIIIQYSYILEDCN